MEQNLPHPEALVPLEPGRRVAYVSGPRGDERDLPLFDLVARHVDAFGDAPAMISGEGTWSVAETWQRVQLLAAELHAAMAGQRLPVVVMARKGLTQGAALLACLRLGVPYIPLNPDDDSLRTRHIMTLAAPFVLVRDADGNPVLSADALTAGDAIDLAFRDDRHVAATVAGPAAPGARQSPPRAASPAGAPARSAVKKPASKPAKPDDSQGTLL